MVIKRNRELQKMAILEGFKPNKEKIVDLLKIDPDFKQSYRAELNRLAKEYVLVPIIGIILFSWLFYIHLDVQIFPNPLLLVILRIGLSVVGMVSVVLYSIRAFRENKSYYLLLIIVIYFELAAAIIAGATAANHAYMSGFLMIVVVLPIVPLERRHSLIILLTTLLVFSFVGKHYDMEFTLPEGKYVRYNIISTFLVAIAAILVLDVFRRRNFENYISTQHITRKVVEQNKELEKANQEQAIINKELQEANKIKGKLLSMAAHDLRGPLQVILLYAKNIEELKANAAESPFFNQIEKAAEKISTNAEKLETLIKKNLEAAIIDSGKLKLNKNPVDLGELAGFVVKTCKSLAEEKNQNIKFKKKSGCVVIGDNVRLGQVMENLLCNAVKFSEKGQSIWVSVEHDEEVVTFTVRDKGPGLNEEDKKNLFKEFQPLTAKPTAGETSTGLGLSIARTLVKLHDGNIQVESEPGRGSTFSVRLPIYKAPLAVA